MTSTLPRDVALPAPSLPSTTRRLVAASFLMLFLELALIRWLGSNVVHLSYFSNFVLLGSFLGIGLGFLRCTKTSVLPFYSPVVLAAFVLFIATNPVCCRKPGYTRRPEPG